MKAMTKSSYNDWYVTKLYLEGVRYDAASYRKDFTNRGVLCII